MVVIKNIPTYLTIPKKSGFFAFDQNGRFIYTYKRSGFCPVIIIYDIIFNKFIELRADSITQHLDNIDDLSNRFSCFLPVDVETMLVALWKTDAPPVEILLLKFDLNQKTYSIADKVLFPDCNQPILLNDENGAFVLFCYKTCKDGRMVGNEPYEEQMEVYITQTFTINESSKICLQDKKEINYSRYNIPEPWHLHFRNNKLWFLRNNKFPRFVSYRVPKPLKPDPDFYLNISFLNLNEEKPKETVVKQIKMEDLPENMLGLQWAGDFLIFQWNLTKFSVFDLNTSDLSYIKHSINLNDPMTNLLDENNEWAEFNIVWSKYNQFTSSTQFFCDKNLNLIAMNNKTQELHKFSLRSPQKLLDLTWNEALNREYVNKMPCVPFECLF